LGLSEEQVPPERFVHLPVGSPDARGSAFGVFNAGFGLAWFAGSAAMGSLHDHSIPSLVILSISLQSAAVPVFFAAHSRVNT